MTNDSAATMDAFPADLPSIGDSEQCLAIAASLDSSGDNKLRRASLERAIALDRSCQAAHLHLAAETLDEGDRLTTYAHLEEAARLAPLPAGVEALRGELCEEAKADGRLSRYLQAVGREPAPADAGPLSVVVITRGWDDATAAAHSIRNLVGGLRARGHLVRVLTTEIASPAPGDDGVFASLRVGSGNERDNAARVRTAVTKSRANIVIAGNMDGLGVAGLKPALAAEMPVIHWHHNEALGYTIDEQPREDHFRLVSASGWLGTAVRNLGYETPRMDVLAAVPSVSRYFRLFTPATNSIRACFVVADSGATDWECLRSAIMRLGSLAAAVRLEVAASPALMTEVESAVRGMDTPAEFVLNGISNGDEASLSRVFDRCNVFLSPALVPDTLGFHVANAMAAGLAVIAASIGAPRELISDGSEGLLYSPECPESLAAALQRLAADVTLLERLQKTGQARMLGSIAPIEAARQIERIAREMSDELDEKRAAEQLPDLWT